MSQDVYFVRLGADNRTILSTGSCPADDIYIQGNVRALEEAPAGVSDATHDWDDVTRQFVQKEETDG